MREKLKDMLIEHEGNKSHLYICTSDKPTIGVGRMIGEGGIGLSHEE